jgi:Ca2+-transporting ATPase
MLCVVDVSNAGASRPPAKTAPLDEAPTLRGLSTAEAQARLGRDGPNVLPSEGTRSPLRVLVDIVKQPMFLLLIAAAALYLSLGDAAEGFVLLGATVFVIAITLIQESRTERALAALHALASPRSQVLRDGVVVGLPARELVAGDIIRIAEGDRVPADAILRVGVSVAADESLLTGESVAVAKHSDTATSELDAPGGRPSGLYSGTLLVSGRGVAEVVATGPRSELGRIGVALRDVAREPSPTERDVTTVVRKIAVLALALSMVLGVLVTLMVSDWIHGALAALTLAMSLLPEELPVVLTVFLALGARRIAAHGVLTRRAAAVEALGAVDVLCTDKTGTLTENRMTIARLWSDEIDRPIAADGELPEEVHALVEFGILACPLDPFDPMERAFHELGRRALAASEHLHASWSDVREYPLTAELLAVAHAWSAPDRRGFVIATKGAPVAVFERCHLAPDARALWSERAAELARQGLRVLAIARAERELDGVPDALEAIPFRFLGLVALHDPLRADVPEAVATCQRAGIRVVMITGDHLETGRAIARAAGIAGTEHALLGSEIDALDDDALGERLAHAALIARATPAHKLRIVRALKARGVRVAMTGDGVNDAPALKAAHIGVAMGKRGTDVAREASSLVLLDDDFGALVTAVSLGRRIFENLRRAFEYIVAVHVPIAGLALLPVLFGWPALLGPVQIMFMELVIDPACSVVFELEPPGSDLMQRPPRGPREGFLDRRRLLWSGALGIAVLIGVLALVGWRRTDGVGEAVERTTAFVALVAGNLALLLANRSATEPFWRTLARPNMGVPILFAAVAAMLALMLWLPPLRHAAGFAPIGLDELGLALAFGALPVLALDVIEANLATRRARRSTGGGA